MAYTVTRRDGANDAEFRDYVRLLRQSGVDLGKLLRVPEPGSKRRWLPVWDAADAAQRFAVELRRRTGNDAWEVVETSASPSEGPLGPVVFQLARRSDGLLFALPPLGQATIQSAFPQTVQAATLFIGIQDWSRFLQTWDALGDLVRQIAPILTGLTMEALDDLGYAVMDADTHETVVLVRPALIRQGDGGRSAAG